MGIGSSTHTIAGHEDELDRAKAELRTVHDNLAKQVEQNIAYINQYMFITLLVCAEEIFDAHIEILEPQVDFRTDVH